LTADLYMSRGNDGSTLNGCCYMLCAVVDPEFYNGGADGRGGGGCAPSPEKIEFLHETGGFWCILGLLFTFM